MALLSVLFVGEIGLGVLLAMSFARMTKQPFPNGRWTTKPKANPEQALARAFARILTEWLGAAGIERVVRENAKEIEPLICHSHDQCDANQAMLDAWEEVFGKGVVPASIRSDATEAEEQASDILWGGAWALAKTECFWGPTKIAPHSLCQPEGGAI